MRAAPAFPKRVALVGLATLIALALAEGAVRVFAAGRPVFELRGLHEYRPDLPWLYGLRPGAEGRLTISGDVPYRINADGFRDALHGRSKPPGVFRVLLMGDSISFGYGVAEEQAYPHLLEAELRRLAPADRVEVLNFGVGGYNAWNEAELLRGVGLGYEPDLVLVQFCINDLNDPTLHFDAQTRMQLGAIPDEAFPDPSRRRVAVAKPSVLQRMCRRSSLCAGLDDLRLAGSLPDADTEMRRAAGAPNDASAGPEWAWLEERYRDMAAASAGVGARFVVLAFPHRGQLGGRGADPVQERLNALGRSHGWTVVDPLPAFRRARAASRAPLFIDLWHAAPAGHRVAADVTLQALACSALLPEASRSACRSGRGIRPGNGTGSGGGLGAGPGADAGAGSG